MRCTHRWACVSVGMVFLQAYAGMRTCTDTCAGAHVRVAYALVHAWVRACACVCVRAFGRACVRPPPLPSLRKHGCVTAHMRPHARLMHGRS